MSGRRNRGADAGPEVVLVFVKATEASGTGTSLRVHANSTMTVMMLRQLVQEQFEHSEVPECRSSLSSWKFQLKGRILNDDFPLFSYHPQERSVLYLRVQGDLGSGFADRFPWQSEPEPEPEAMSAAEIKAKLKKMGAFRPALTFDQLVECLRVHQQKQSRPQRLTQACIEASCAKSLHVRRKLAEVERTGGKGKCGGLETLDLAVYGDGNGGLDVTSGLGLVQAVKHESKQLRRWRLAPAPICTQRRAVFVSVAEFQSNYHEAMMRQDAELQNSVFFFDADRSWVFPPVLAVPEPSRHAQLFNVRYIRCSPDFLELIKAKEEQGLCYWFRPHRDWARASAFFQGIREVGGVTGGTGRPKQLHPLQLNVARWLSLAGQNGWEGEARQDGRENDPSCIPRYSKNVAKIASVLQGGSCDFGPVMEIIYQSNRNLDPQCSLCPPLTAKTSRTA